MILVHIDGHVNPFRGDKFAEGWAAAAELVLDFGARLLGLLPRDRRAARLHPGRRLPDQGPLGALLVLGGGRGEAHRSCRATSTCPVLPELYEIVGEGRALSLAPEEQA